MSEDNAVLYWEGYVPVNHDHDHGYYRVVTFKQSRTALGKPGVCVEKCKGLDALDQRVWEPADRSDALAVLAFANTMRIAFPEG